MISRLRSSGDLRTRFFPSVTIWNSVPSDGPSAGHAWKTSGCFGSPGSSASTPSRPRNSRQNSSGCRMGWPGFRAPGGSPWPRTRLPRGCRRSSFRDGCGRIVEQRADDFGEPLGAGHRQRIPVAEFDEVLQTHVVEVRGDHMVDLVRVELAVRVHVVRVLVERRRCRSVRLAPIPPLRACASGRRTSSAWTARPPRNPPNRNAGSNRPGITLVRWKSR